MSAGEVVLTEAQVATQRRRLLWIVLIALALRLAVMSLGHTYRFDPKEDHFGFGWETGRIARAIATGHGFSDPFEGETGPTAWIAPVYPYFLAGVFKVFGVYSNGSAWAALAVNSLFSALTAIPLFVLGNQLFSERVGWWTAWVWALLPYSIYWAIRFAWETVFATFLLTSLLLLVLRLERESRARLWVLFGLIWGVLALTNTSLLAFLPFCSLWIWMKRADRARTLGNLVLAGALFCIVVGPWMARNWVVFGKVLPIRGNAGVEFRLGNGPGADGTWMAMLHPSRNVAEFEKYQRLGEVAYAAQRKQEAFVWIRANPGMFLEITAKRIVYYWAGSPRPGTDAEYLVRQSLFVLSSLLAFLGLVLALRRRKRAAWLLASMMLSLPMIYYVTFTHPRYRVPLEPVMLLLIVHLFSEARRAESGKAPAVPSP